MNRLTGEDYNVLMEMVWDLTLLLDRWVKEGKISKNRRGRIKNTIIKPIVYMDLLNDCKGDNKRKEYIIKSWLKEMKKK